MVEKKELTDFIVLGRAAPDVLKNGRKTYCIGGWSDTHKYIRIYPTSRKADLKRWTINKIPVEKNPADIRKESWKVEGSQDDWDSLDKKIIKIGKLKRKGQIELLDRLPKYPCIDDINAEKRSLGIIIPSEILDYYLKERDTYENSKMQFSLDEILPGENTKQSKTLIKDNFKYIPYIKWRCEGPCKFKQGFHKSQLLSLEAYEWFRKVGVEDQKAQMKVFDNLQLKNSEYNFWFFVGNTNQHKKSFMIISVLRFKISPIEESQQTLLTEIFR